MVAYCPECGRQTPDDAIVCPYCGKNISQNKIIKSKEYEQPKEKNNTKLIAIIAIVIILLLVIPAIAATVYVYVSGMGPADGYHHTPNIVFVKNLEAHTLTVINIDTSTVTWEEISIIGNCNTTGLTGYILEGQQITNCQGTIRIIYQQTYTLLGEYDFS